MAESDDHVWRRAWQQMMEARTPHTIQEPIDVEVRLDVWPVPVAFTWRGARYIVHQRIEPWHLVDDWRETGHASDRWEYLVYSLMPGRSFGDVFELYLDRRQDVWTLERVHIYD